MEIKAAESFLKQNYALLKDLFDTAQCTPRFPQVGNGEVLEMCDRLKISGTQKDALKPEPIQICYKGANFRESSNLEGKERNT